MARERGYFLFKPDTRYAYAVGRIRSLERRYLTSQDIERLIATEEPEEAYRFLVEKGYTGGELKIKTWSDLESCLAVERQQVLALISTLCQDTPISNLFRERYDFHNLKVLLKARYSGQDLDHLLIDVGTVGVESLTKAVAEDDYRSMPQFIRNTVQVVNSGWEKTNNPQFIDILADCEMYKRFDSVIRPFGNHFLNGWLDLEIDLANIKTLLRVKWLGLDAAVLTQSLVEAGSIKKSELFSLRETPWEATVSFFSKTRYAKTVATGTDALLKSGSFLPLERAADATLISCLERAKVQSLGIEPLVAYLLLKEYEFKAVRIVVVGKTNQLSAELIRERLPEYP
ncbi:MAG: V-type ATP synthase subunit C [Candidatus Latescibacteria bacterium]|nr:V-type ATP synthase subunit C [Candidatus Latescibacterota bacterium]